MGSRPSPAGCPGMTTRPSVRASPAGMRDIDDDAVRAGPFHLEIGVTAGGPRRIDMVLRGQPLAARAFELLASLVAIADLEPEMMDAREVRALRAPVRRFPALSVEDPTDALTT